MVDKKTIEIVKNRLIETYKPLEIYLFGSYAWGHPDNESDLDLLVVVDSYTDTWHNLMVQGHTSLIDLDLSKDILLFSKEDFEKKASHVSTLCHKIKYEGVKIYARA